MTKDIQIDIADSQKRNTDETVFITGAPRSGTSLLGALISTFAGIEYHHEPPMFWVFTALLSMKALSPSAASCLLKLYLFEELLVESVHGRRANLRPSDESLLLKSISWPELLSRWQTIKNRADAIRRIEKDRLRLAVKVPSILDSIEYLASEMPRSKFVIIVRDGYDVVRSIVKKEWFTDEGLKENYWPYKVVNGHKLPVIVEDAVADKWITMNAVTRASYLWRRDLEFALRIKESALKMRLHFLSYEALRQNPTQVMVELGRFLKAELTTFSEVAIRSIRPFGENARKHSRNEFVDSIEPDELEKFHAMNAAWGYDYTP